MFTTLVSNFTAAGRVRREYENGREYLVAPVTMIVSGVLKGSLGPLLYPADEVARNATEWNGVPLVVDHPFRNGKPTTARTHAVLQERGIGEVRHARAVGGKLVAEGWFDVEATERVDRRILTALRNGQQIELSTGLELDVHQQVGFHRGMEYWGVARNFVPDHLAILPDTVGACSLTDGCGVLANVFINPSRKETRTMLQNRLLGLPVANDWDDADGDADDDRLVIPTINYGQPTDEQPCKCKTHDANAHASLDDDDLLPPRLS